MARISDIFAEQRAALEKNVERGVGRARGRFIGSRAGTSSFGSPVSQFGLGKIEEAGLSALSTGLAQIGNLELQFRFAEEERLRREQERKAGIEQRERRSRLGGILGFGGGALGAIIGSSFGAGGAGVGLQAGRSVGGLFS